MTIYMKFERLSMDLDFSVYSNIQFVNDSMQTR